MPSFDVKALNLKSVIDRLKFKSVPRDLLVVDFSQVEAKCCRLRQTNAGVQLVAADVLPRLQEEASAGEGAAAAGKAITLPANLMARHVAVCLSGQNALIKLLNLPGQLDGDSEMKIREDMGIGTGEYRIGYQVLGHSHGRVETKLVTVALPEKDIQHYLGYFATGWPVPVSVELAGLSAVNAFVRGYLDVASDDTLGVIQFEDYVSFFAFLHKKEMVLIRKFEFGHEHVLSAIQSHLNVNRETALNVASDQSFDITQMIKEVCDPFIRQFVISKHFVERRENCRVSQIFIPGTAPASHRLAQEIRVASEGKVEQWDPLKSVTVAPDAVSSRVSLTGQYSQFAASIGAGLGFFGEKNQ
jgi:Tfp pilus assembly PilM family ATPase